MTDDSASLHDMKHSVMIVYRALEMGTHNHKHTQTQRILL